MPEGHMVKIVKEESMQSTQGLWGGKFEFEGETFIPGDVIINPKSRRGQHDDSL